MMSAKANTPRVGVVVIAQANGLDQDWIEALQSDPGIELMANVGLLKRGVEAVEQLQPDVLVIDRSVEEIEETLNAVYPVAPSMLSIAVLPGPDMASMRRLVAAGARDVLAKPFQPKELVVSIRQVVQVELARRQRAGLSPS